MSWLETEQALMQSLTGLSLGIPILQEGDSQERITKAQGSNNWLEVANLPAGSIALDKALSDQDNGIYQISVYGKKNIGKGSLLDLIDQIIPTYKTGKSFTNGLTEVNFESSAPSPMRPDGSFNVIDISIVLSNCRQPMVISPLAMFWWLATMASQALTITFINT